jgi:hypothetical protein
MENVEERVSADNPVSLELAVRRIGRSVKTLRNGIALASFADRKASVTRLCARDRSATVWRKLHQAGRGLTV